MPQAGEIVPLDNYGLLLYTCTIVAGLVVTGVSLGSSEFSEPPVFQRWSPLGLHSRMFAGQRVCVAVLGTAASFISPFLDPDHVLNPTTILNHREVVMAGAKEVVPADCLWTVGDVSEFLKLRPFTVRAMAREGRLPVVRIGRQLRFVAVDIRNKFRGEGR